MLNDVRVMPQAAAREKSRTLVYERIVVAKNNGSFQDTAITLPDDTIMISARGQEKDTWQQVEAQAVSIFFAAVLT